MAYEPSSSRPDALVRHLRVWGFVALEQNEIAGLFLPPVYSKSRELEHWDEPLLDSCSSSQRYLHCGFSLFHSCWGVSGSFCLDYSTLRFFPTCLLPNTSVGRKALKAKHCSHGPAHTFLAEHGRPGLAIPNLNLVPVEQSRMGCKSTRNLSNIS